MALAKPGVLFIDFGSQYSYVLEKKLRLYGLPIHRIEFQISENLLSIPETLQNFKAIILSGGPASILELKENIHINQLCSLLRDNHLSIPILGICFGMQLIHWAFGGEVAREKPLFGEGEVIIREASSPIVKGLPERFKIWASYSESVVKLGSGFHSIAQNGNGVEMISAHSTRPIYTIQFHPEVNESEFGNVILSNFLVGLLENQKKGWDNEVRENSLSQEFIPIFEAKKREVLDKIGSSKVLLLISGGVDSTVLFFFLKSIIPEQNIFPLYLSTQLIPKYIDARIRAYFRREASNFRIINWGDRIFKKLKGITSPEEKRRVISRMFKESLEQIGTQDFFKGITFLAQGTIASDYIESGMSSRESEVIKSHHNILMFKEIKELPYSIIEPFKEFFKNEIREIGRYLNVPGEFLSQKPFPGPGLSIRVIGEVSREKVELLSGIHEFLEIEFMNAGLSHISDQYFPILLSDKSVGVKGDRRTFGYVISIRAIQTIDYMCAKVSPIEINLLIKIANKIISHFPLVSRVLYDLSTKPPSTIEWE